ncbi:MAG: MmcB family DNA repair protein, partial [Hyphomicrobiaceae bacterium]|nr:MmcB family DNA repair protein [Hyphomicrobiaceae bacterium]
ARLAPARRKSMTLRFARAAALALHTAVDPSHENS